MSTRKHVKAALLGLAIAVLGSALYLCTLGDGCLSSGRLRAEETLLQREAEARGEVRVAAPEFHARVSCVEFEHATERGGARLRCRMAWCRDEDRGVAGPTVLWCEP